MTWPGKLSGLLVWALATQMLRFKLISRLTHDPKSIWNPSQWVASAVRDAMKEADGPRFQKSEWGQQFLGGWHSHQ